MPPANNEESKYIIEITTEEEFNQLLKRSKAILFIAAEWSVPSRASWYTVSRALQQIGVLTIPTFQLDASEDIPYFINWIQEQRNVKPDFIYGGWGETVLIEHGNVTDFIHCPSKHGSEKTIEKIRSWK